MVFYSTLTQVRAAYADMVGKYAYLTSYMAPDVMEAVQLANLQRGQRVFDIGTGGGSVIAAAKVAVRGGLCIGLDAVQGFLDVDVPHELAQQGLRVAPAGDASNQMHLVCGSATDGNLRNALEARVGQPAQFDVSFAIHILNTIPPAQRRQALLDWKRMLAPGGRLIVTMSALFTNALLSSITGPIQFSPVDSTEAPGSFCLIANSIHSHVQAADNSTQLERVLLAAVQVAPNQLWQVAQEQANQAAHAVNLRVVCSRNIGDGRLHPLPPGQSSPSPADMGSQALTLQWMQNATIHGRQCWGRFCERFAYWTLPAYRNSPPGRVKNYWLTRVLQEFVKGQISNVDEQRAQILAQSSQRQSASVAEFAQVGVLVELAI